MSDNTGQAPTVTANSGVPAGVLVTTPSLTLEFEQTPAIPATPPNLAIPATWVTAKDYHFLIGKLTEETAGRKITFRLKTALPAGVTADPPVVIPGTDSGTVGPVTIVIGTATPTWSFTPTVTTTNPRPTSGTIFPNTCVEYSIKVTVTGQSQPAPETIKQDDRDIIRQEYLDSRMFVPGFTLEVPTLADRDKIKEQSSLAFTADNSYTLVLDKGMNEMYKKTRDAFAQAAFGQAIAVGSGWRSPRRNRNIPASAINSPHQTGHAVDMVPANPLAAPPAGGGAAASTGTPAPAVGGAAAAPSGAGTGSIPASGTPAGGAPAVTKYKISGYAGVAGATLTYKTGEGTLVKADGSVVAYESGYYEFDVPANWTGTLTPSKKGTPADPAVYPAIEHVFDPPNKVFPIVTANQVQNFVTDAAKRRRNFVLLYKAALSVPGQKGVLLEQVGTGQLLPKNYVLPLPTAQDPDNDKDGLPDNATGPPGYADKYSVIFDKATHVHGVM